MDLCYYICLERIFNETLPFVFIVQWHRDDGDDDGEIIENEVMKARMPRMLLASNKKNLKKRLDIYLMCTDYKAESIIDDLPGQ